MSAGKAAPLFLLLCAWSAPAPQAPGAGDREDPPGPRARQLAPPIARPTDARPAADRCVFVDGRKACVEGPLAANLPLLIYLHGYGGSGSDDLLGLARLAKTQSFLYAAPDALPDAANRREWIASDLKFVARLIDRLVDEHHADATRVYLVGFSLGAFLALEFACVQPSRIAAAVAVSGTRFEPAAACAQGSVSTLHIHGDRDTTIAPAGGVGRRTGLRYASVRGVAALAASAAGFGRELAPAGTLDSGAQVERAVDCRGGAKVEVRMLPGVGHLPAVDAHLGDAIWAFLQGLQRTTPATRQR